MLDNFDPIAYVKEAGGALKFGSGVLGKSTYAVGVVLIAAVVAIARLHSDTAIIIALVMSIAAFFGWFTFVLTVRA